MKSCPFSWMSLIRRRYTARLARGGAARGTRVKRLCPPWVGTDLARQGISEPAAILGVSAEEFGRQAVKAIPIQRMIEASEVGALAVYLASPRAAGITGQALNICGGVTAGAGD